VDGAQAIKRRFADLALELDLRRDSFIATPRVEQRRWLVDRAIDELVDQLRHLDGIAAGLVPGKPRSDILQTAWATAEPSVADGTLTVAGQQVMQDWEQPLMQRLADIVASSGGDVLEIGFGLGISASLIQAAGVRSHTIVELNRTVAETAEAWRAQQESYGIAILNGAWEDAVTPLGQFDGILWDAFPTSDAEFAQTVIRDNTVAERFFPEAARHLKSAGVFAYYSNERDSLSREHQRSLLRHFSSFSIEEVQGLQPPSDCDYWWHDQMVVVSATKA
jgi:guanidinoacetate N-methyltransferase